MAFNEPAAYGRDVRAVLDADTLFSSVEGIDVLYQAAIHRITTDSVLGDDGTGSLVIDDWGFDCRRLLGMHASKAKAYQPILAERITRDPRIDSAQIIITPTRVNGLEDLEIRGECQTALGPFPIYIKSVRDLLASDLVGQR